MKVAIYDEKESRELPTAQREQRDQNNNSGPVRPDDSLYRWVYRPEMQYSVFDLDVRKIEGYRQDENDQDALIREYTPENDIINGDIESLTLVQYLKFDTFGPLTAFAGERDLIYSLGGNEQQLEPSSELDSVERLDITTLDAHGFLALNLLDNKDTANILSEEAAKLMTFGRPPVSKSATDSLPPIRAC